MEAVAGIAAEAADFMEAVAEVSTEAVEAEAFTVVDHPAAHAASAEARGVSAARAALAVRAADRSVAG